MAHLHYSKGFLLPNSEFKSLMKLRAKTICYLLGVLLQKNKETNKDSIEQVAFDHKFQWTFRSSTWRRTRKSLPATNWRVT